MFKKGLLAQVLGSQVQVQAVTLAWPGIRAADGNGGDNTATSPGELDSRRQGAVEPALRSALVTSLCREEVKKKYLPMTMGFVWNKKRNKQFLLCLAYHSNKPYIGHENTLKMKQWQKHFSEWQYYVNFLPKHQAYSVSHHQSCSWLQTLSSLTLVSTI